jgi:hypothetical protein
MIFSSIWKPFDIDVRTRPIDHEWNLFFEKNLPFWPLFSRNQIQLKCERPNELIQTYFTDARPVWIPTHWWWSLLVNLLLAEILQKPLEDQGQLFRRFARWASDQDWRLSVTIPCKVCNRDSNFVLKAMILHTLQVTGAGCLNYRSECFWPSYSLIVVRLGR